MARAAAELNVTQSAVSHQIKSLEENLELKLFLRTGRTLSLTTDGQNLLASVQTALQGITSTCIQLGDDVFSGELVIAAPASFATLWLMPRISNFLDPFPNLTIRRKIINSEPGSQLPESDIAIVFNEPKFPGKRATCHDATEIARSGLGLAINDKYTGASALEKGELIRPFGNETMTHGQYYLLTAPQEKMSEPAMEFERWIRQEMVG
jgi:DNA-binding transcriptional LysR family regulator